MTLEELADLIRANSANTNGRIDGVSDRIDGVSGRIDGVVDRFRNLHSHIDRAQNETNAALMNIPNDLTDLRADVAEVRRSLDLATTVAEMRKQIDTLTAEAGELKRRVS